MRDHTYDRMNYEMEELVPIVGMLAGKFAGCDSTSITYEQAEKLMKAVLYCIQEAEQMSGDFSVRTNKMSAEQAYEAGLECVKRKVSDTLKKYNSLTPDFDAFENRCLYDTVIKGIPEFFKWYDVRFDPQDTIVTLDYPILKDLSGLSGIDRILEYVRCIELEQQFLARFPRAWILQVLRDYSAGYRDMIENLCEIVLKEILTHMSPEKAPAAEVLRGRIRELVSKYYGDSDDLRSYLFCVADDLAVRLKIVAGLSLD